MSGHRNGMKLVNAEEYEQLKNEHTQLNMVVEELLAERKVLKAELDQYKQLAFTLQTGSSLTLN